MGSPVDAQSNIFWYEARVNNVEALTEKLKKVAAKKPQPEVQIRGDMSARYEGVGKAEIRLLPDMTKGRHPRTVFINGRLREELETYAAITRCVDRSYPLFASQKSVREGFSANSLAQTFALLYAGAGLAGASSHSGRRTFLTSLANKGTAIHILKTLAGHRNIATTAAYLYSSPAQLRAAVELV